MFSTYERLLKYSQSVTPRPEFVEVVIDRIAQEERRAAWRQSLFLFATGYAILAGLRAISARNAASFQCSPRSSCRLSQLHILD